MTTNLIFGRLAFNLSQITDDEISRLSNFDSKNEIVAIKTDSNSISQIITISKSSVNLWQLFLRIFGWGDLANTQFHFSEVISYLSKFQWNQDFAHCRKDSNEYQAYLKVCSLANKALVSSLTNSYPITCETKDRIDRFLKSVVSDTVELGFDFTQLDGDGSQVFLKEKLSHNFDLNPEMQIDHVKALIRYRFSNAAIEIKDVNGNAFDKDQKTTEDDLARAKITVHQYLS